MQYIAPTRDIEASTVTVFCVPNTLKIDMVGIGGASNVATNILAKVVDVIVRFRVTAPRQDTLVLLGEQGVKIFEASIRDVERQSRHRAAELPQVAVVHEFVPQFIEVESSTPNPPRAVTEDALSQVETLIVDAFPVNDCVDTNVNDMSSIEMLLIINWE